MSCPLLIIQTGHTPDPIRARHGDFDHWFRLATRCRRDQVQTVDVGAGQPLPALAEVERVLVTGSSAMLTDPPDWVDPVSDWLMEAFKAKRPMFGVCFGHQLMCRALGGQIDWLDGPREMGTKRIELLEAIDDDPLLRGFPRQFYGHTTHSQTVCKAPDSAQVLARSRREHHHIVRYAPHAMSTQFHPEMSVAVIRDYIKLRRDGLREEGQVPDCLLRATRPTPWARRLLHRFARL
ncbi:glutamine amidotransferase [Oleiagrimonas sp. C23AA]|uniref:glutamine amidotransferase n=1 Tax=Oleiagrimonas sp. C23AA TaxID=2719047 RepID=UPI00142429A0|nr:glutamine amidotransferase [Oleiagrimonas sp. C23AA]NII12216.1 glutamine amidotransferase [Oleiagrimonas sp. C23AA]